MPGFLNLTFIILVLNLLAFGGPLATKCVSMNNQSCMATPMLIGLNPDERHYCLFIISLDRCEGNCNTTECPVGRIYVPNKIEDVNLKVFNAIKEIS